MHFVFFDLLEKSLIIFNDIFFALNFIFNALPRNIALNIFAANHYKLLYLLGWSRFAKTISLKSTKHPSWDSLFVERNLGKIQHWIETAKEIRLCHTTYDFIHILTLYELQLIKLFQTIIIKQNQKKTNQQTIIRQIFHLEK